MLPSVLGSSATSVPIRVPYKYTYSHEDYHGMGQRLSVIAQEQLREDFINQNTFEPLLRENIEQVPSTDSISVFSIGDTIAVTQQSIIFGIQETRKYVIKYQADCDRKGPIHPLLRDAWFLNLFRDTAIVPKVLFVSPPTPMGMGVSLKTNFHITPTERAYCVVENRSVRFMVMERMSGDLYALMNRMLRPSFKLGIDIMIKLVDGIREIHDRGVVHGDIHPGNIGLIPNPEDPRMSDLVFFDFGSAFFIEEKTGLDDRERPRLDYVHCLYSHWNLEGYRFSYRDDVYKILMIGAMLLNGRSWTDYCVDLESDGEAMLLFKRDSFIFEFPGGPDFIGSLPFRLGQRKTIRSKLEAVLDSVRSLNGINDVPDYDFVIEQLAEIYRMVQKRT